MGILLVLLFEISFAGKLKNVVLVTLGKLIYLFRSQRNLFVEIVSNLDRLLSFNLDLVHLFECQSLVFPDSNQLFFNFEIETSHLVQHLAFGVRYEVCLVLKPFLKVFDLELDGFGEQFEVIEPKGAIIELGQNGSLLFFNLHVNMLSFYNVVVYAFIDVIERLVTPLLLIENNLKFSAPLLQFLYFLLLADHLFAVLLLRFDDWLQQFFD